MITMALHLHGFTFAAFNAKKYSGGCGSYDYSIFDRVFNVFLPIKTTHLLYKVFFIIKSKAYDVVLVVDPVSH